MKLTFSWLNRGCFAYSGEEVIENSVSAGYGRFPLPAHRLRNVAEFGHACAVSAVSMQRIAKVIGFEYLESFLRYRASKPYQLS